MIWYSNCHRRLLHPWVKGQLCSTYSTMPHSSFSWSTDLVLAEAWGYPLAAYSAYVVSLRNTDYDGDVKLLGPLSAITPEIRRLCSAFRVQIVDVPTPSKPLVERFAHFAEQCTRKRYHRCIATDFRDVVFQSNPFVWLGSRAWPGGIMPALVLPLEPFTIGTCDVGRHPVTEELTKPNAWGSCMNSRTIRKCSAGTSSAFGALSRANVVCSGVVAGSPEGLAALAKELVPNGLRCAGSGSDMLIDQAALNLFVYGGSALLAMEQINGSRHQPPTPPTPRVTEQRPRSKEAEGAANDVAMVAAAGVASSTSFPAAASVASISASASTYWYWMLPHASADGEGEGISIALEPRGMSFTNTIGVLTHTPNRSLAFVREHMLRGGVVLNDDGEPSPIVHQYDRLLKWHEVAMSRRQGAAASTLHARPHGAGAMIGAVNSIAVGGSARRSSSSSPMLKDPDRLRYKLRLRAIDDAVRLGKLKALGGFQIGGRASGGYNAEAGDSDSWMRPA